MRDRILRIVLSVLITCTLLSSCGLVEKSREFLVEEGIIEEEQSTEIETEPPPTYEELVAEYMSKTYEAFKDKIGESKPGERIVELLDYGDRREYSVYIFDDNGYSHEFYLFAYNDIDFEYNQKERVEDIHVARKSLIADSMCNVVYFKQDYIAMGSNAYNFFRQSILKKYEDEQKRLDLDKLEDVKFLELDGGTSTLVGNLGEYKPPKPELVIDSTGYTLALNTEDLFTTVKADGGVVITGYSGEGGDKLIFPSTINGDNVVEIRKMQPVVGIKAVEVPAEVKHLTDSFEGWSELEHIFLVEGLESITTNTLTGTSIKNISLPNTVSYLGEGFYSLNNITEIKLPSSLSDISGVLKDLQFENFIIPGTVKVVGEAAFSGCTNLKALFIEEGVEKISAKAFENCSLLQAVAVPSTVTEIENGAIPVGVMLVVKAGSYAEAYANKNNIVYSVQ